MQEIRLDEDGSQRRSKRRSLPPSGADSPPIDVESDGVGELYLDLYDPPPLASATQTYMETYAVVRAILESESVPHAQVAAKAARDAAASHIERRLAVGGLDHG